MSTCRMLRCPNSGKQAVTECPNVPVSTCQNARTPGRNLHPALLTRIRPSVHNATYSFRMSECLNVRMSECPYVRMPVCLNARIRMHECPNARMSKRLIVRNVLTIRHSSITLKVPTRRDICHIFTQNVRMSGCPNTQMSARDIPSISNDVRHRDELHKKCRNATNGGMPGCPHVECYDVRIAESKR